ncbi:hypothetical protein ARMSODRAFT_66522 [Armillaria solidipes]|uniref:JmjC domain-containing protein n=1 Tax=Armillaria solidipes TaxID=1076256 RepID=A0A2H3C4Z9_9AGAR|nr:hypothetical protein ARMSODRAFT_66522 [Armillaria solidipes]
MVCQVSDMVSRHAREDLILLDSNDHVVFLRPPFPDDATLIETIVDHLAHNRGIKLEGLQEPEIVESLTCDYMSKRWNVHPKRRVDVHDGGVVNKRCLHPRSEMFQWQFIEGLSDPKWSDKVLDIPMSQWGGPPLFGLINDECDAWNNTSQEYSWPTGMSREQWSDMNWGAEHHAAVYTKHHHDGQGKNMVIVAEQGCKLWTAYSPVRPYTRREVQEYYNGTLELYVNDLSSSEEDVEGEGPQRLDYAVGYTLLMLPGDCYFQPAGAIHAVYTPEASFTRGSSFWSLSTMHQVEPARLYDATYGNLATNTDRNPVQVYKALVCMMLNLPTNPERRVHFSRSRLPSD